MSYEITISKKATKSFKYIEKGQKRDALIITNFIEKILKTADNPCALPNARKLVGYKDNRYRWRLGNYRIIGRVENGEFKIIEILYIGKRDESTYKGS